MMLQLTGLRAFGELLCSSDRRIRTQAWELALQHGWPVVNEGSEAGTARVVVINHVPRPEKQVTVEVAAGMKDER
jgi:hypothetical protein